MRILVTNDDGIEAPGIVPLAAVAVDAGHDVVVAAPLLDLSGIGAAIWRMHADRSLHPEAVELRGLPGVPCFAVDGPPALAVLNATRGELGEPPELVLSGINPGMNTGASVLHSGTVGAALTAANAGLSALAVSLQSGDQYPWDTAAALAGFALGWLLDQPATTVLNLNVPNLPLEQVKGVRRARLAPFGTVRAAIAESKGGNRQMELAERSRELAPDTDTALVRAGYAAVTSIVGVREAESDAGDALESSFLRQSA